MRRSWTERNEREKRKDPAAGQSTPEVAARTMVSIRARKKEEATTLVDVEDLVGAEALAGAVEVLQVESGRPLIATAIFVAERATSAGIVRRRNRNKEFLFDNTIRYTFV